MFLDDHCYKQLFCLKYLRMTFCCSKESLLHKTFDTFDGFSLDIQQTTIFFLYGQHFVTETMFYFCSNMTCINSIPSWTNLNPPRSIVADKSSEFTLNKLKESGLSKDLAVNII